MEIKLGLIALGLFLAIIGAALYEFWKIFVANKDALQDEAVRFQKGFSGNSAEKTRSSATLGTSLSFESGNTKIIPQSRLSIDSYL